MAGADSEQIAVRGEFITLGQLLSVAGVTGSGGESKAYLQRQRVLVNGVPEGRRGRKLHPGDSVTAAGHKTILLVQE